MNITFLLILIITMLIIVFLFTKMVYKKNNYNNNDVEQRVNYYLSTHLNDNIKTDKKITLDELKLNRDSTEIYVSPFEELLIKTNNENKTFNIILGDVRKPNYNLELCKTRNVISRNSVILRCLNLNRHWNNYYNRPKDIPYDKKENKIFWRGTTTGSKDNPANRFTLIEKWFNKNKNIDIGLSGICHGKDDYNKYVKGSINTTKFLKYKYILSIEGNDKDSGINWKLNSNSLVLMAKPNVVSWLMEDKLIPDFHYVLLKDDFSDLEEKLEWCNNNQDKCKEMIKNANKYMSQFSDITKEEEIEIKVINKYFEILNNIENK